MGGGGGSEDSGFECGMGSSSKSRMDAPRSGS